MRRSALLRFHAQLALVAGLFLSIGQVSFGAGAPAAPSDLTATATTGGIELHWTDNSSNELGFKIERSQQRNGGYSRIDRLPVGTTSFTDSNLRPNTIYYYRVRAYDSRRNSEASNIASATSLSDLTAPSVIVTSPTDAGSLSTASSSITISGTASDNIAVTSVTWSNSAGGNGDAIGTTSWASSNLTLSPGTNTFTFTALDAAGNAGTTTMTVYYTPLDTTAPTLSISQPNNGQTFPVQAITISGNASDSSGLETVTVNGVVAKGTATWSAPVVLNVGTNTITIIATDNSPAHNQTTKTVSVVYTPPDVTAPSLTLTAPTSGTTVNGVISMSATASDNVGVNKVEFYRDANVLLATDTASPFAASFDTRSFANGPHAFYAIAYDTAGNTTLSSTATVTFNNPPPSAPDNLSGSALSTSQIALNWTDNSSNETGFKLERSTSSSFASVTTVAIAANVSNYTDTGLSVGTTYFYRVKAYSLGWGDSTYSSTLVVATQSPDTAAPATPTGLATSAGDAKVDVSWNANTESDLGGYHLYRGTSQSGSYSRRTTSPQTSRTFTDTGLSNGQTYYYRVSAVDNAGNESSFSPAVTGSPTSGVVTGPQGTIPLALKSVGTAQNNAAVFTGVPFPPGILTNVNQIDLIINGQSAPRQVQSLSTYPDGSQRVVMLGFRATLTAGQTINASIRYGTGVSGTTLTPSLTWTRNLNVLAMLPPSWYGQSSVFNGRFQASSDNTLFPAFESTMLAQYADTSDPVNTINQDLRSYYDHVHALYVTLLRSGGPNSTLQRIWTEVQQYRENEILHSGTHIGQYSGGSYTSNSYPMDFGTIRRMYVQGLLEDYYFTGDARSLQVAQDIGNALLIDAYQRSPEEWTWTERTPGWTIHGLMAIYEATLDPDYLDAALYVAGIEMDHQDAMAQKYPNQGGIAGQTGAFVQDYNGKWFDPDESSVSGAGSPFMTTGLCEALIRLYWITGDTRVRDSVVKASDWLADAAYVSGSKSYIYICRDSNYGGTPSLNPMFLEMLGFAYQVTGDSKYLNQANAILSVNDWGNTLKEFNQSMRNCGQGLYLLHRAPGTVQLTLDESGGANIPPSLSITAPAPGATVSGTTVTVTYTKSGNLTGIGRVSFQIDNNPEVFDVDFDGTFQIANVTPGTHLLKGYLAKSDNSKVAGTDVSVTFTTVAAPAAPSALNATGGNQAANLSWTDNSSNETGFKIERAASASGPWAQIATVGAGVTSYADAGLNSATTYYYQVRAYNSTGNSAYTSVASATTTTSATMPSAPSGLSASKGSSSTINIWWTDNSDNETGFKIERSNSYSGPWTLVATLAANTTSYTDTGLTASTFYAYRARATNAAGDSGNSNISGDTTLAGSAPPPTVPTAPTSLSASSLSANQIGLTWTDNASNESGYKIERALTGSGPWTQVGTTGANGTSFTDSGLTPSTLYYYRVRATNSTGDSAYSNQAITTTMAGTTGNPAAPGGLVASAMSATQINLVWVDNSNNETGFVIERAMSASGPWTQIATTGANVSSYTDTGLSASSTYYYRVSAVN